MKNLDGFLTISPRTPSFPGVPAGPEFPFSPSFPILPGGPTNPGLPYNSIKKYMIIWMFHYKLFWKFNLLNLK